MKPAPNKKSSFIFMAVSFFIIVFIFSIGNLLGDTETSYEKEEKSQEEPKQEEELTPEEKQKLLEKEKKQKEEELREEYGEFFVPLPPLDRPENPPVTAKGLYLTGHSVGHSRYDDILEMVDDTELNSLVIDVKEDGGNITYDSNIEYVDTVNSEFDHVPISDLEEVLDDLHEKDIYPIARVVVFRDPHLAEEKSDLAIQRADGDGIWRDRKGTAWVNPYKEEVWDYNIAVAKEAAKLGFREIQFDYVRFPENAAQIEDEVKYPGEDGVEKDDNIAEFLEYAYEELEDYDVHVAADVFGVIVTSWGDTDQIGQTWEKIAPIVDYNCPMIYPSHYGPGYFGFDVPDANPEGVIRRAHEDAIKRNAQIDEPAELRPWLQGFTAGWIPGNISYGPEEVRTQIDAGLEMGIEDFLIWDASNNYMRLEDAFLSEEEAEKRAQELEEERKEKGHDHLRRTAKEALDIYIDAINDRDWREVYSLHRRAFEVEPKDIKDGINDWTATVAEYDVLETTEEEDYLISVKLDVVIDYGDGEKELNNDQWEIFMENNVWKMNPSGEFIELLSYEEEEDNEEESEENNDEN